MLIDTFVLRRLIVALLCNAGRQRDLTSGVLSLFSGNVEVKPSSERLQFSSVAPQNKRTFRQITIMPPKKGTRKTAAKKKGAPAPAPAPASAPAPAPARKWIPSTSTGPDVPVDPTVLASWEGAEPENEDEMQDWMERERNLVLRYLEYWKEQTEHGPTRQRKESLENALNEVWDESWKPFTDPVTGEIYDETAKDNVEQQMAAAYQTSVGDYDAKVANDAHLAYQYAQGYWEGKHIPTPYERFC